MKEFEHRTFADNRQRIRDTRATIVRVCVCAVAFAEQCAANKKCYEKKNMK